MNVHVRTPGLEPSQALREHAVRRVHLHLSRFAHEIITVHLRISDVNGPDRGGLDKRCQVEVRGPRLREAIVDVSGDPYAAVDLAVERAGHAVARELQRARSTRT